MNIDLSGEQTVNLFITNEPRNDADIIPLTLEPMQGKTISYDSEDNQFLYSNQDPLQLAENDRFWLGYYDDEKPFYEYYQHVSEPGKQYVLGMGDAPVSMVDASPVPAPAAAWVLGAGLLGLMGYRMNGKRKDQ